MNSGASQKGSVHDDHVIAIAPSSETDVSWEDASPCFRVFIFDSSATDIAGSSDAYDIEGADFLQTLDWAQQNTRGLQTFAIALVTSRASIENARSERGLTWLLGCDANEAPPTSLHAMDVRARMIARRADPARIPVRDQIQTFLSG